MDCKFLQSMTKLTTCMEYDLKTTSIEKPNAKPFIWWLIAGTVKSFQHVIPLFESASISPQSTLLNGIATVLFFATLAKFVLLITTLNTLNKRYMYCVFGAEVLMLVLFVVQHLCLECTSYALGYILGLTLPFFGLFLLVYKAVMRRLRGQEKAIAATV